ncbi:MAG: hypothetical protein ACE5KA_07960 [Nitrososphaerales archaeon]
MIRDTQHSAKIRANKLKEIALSLSNTGSERMRAIDLLGQLNNDVYDELSDIAAKGLSRNERINALEMLAKVSKRTLSKQLNVQLKQVKNTKAEGKTSYKVGSNDNLPQELFNDMLNEVRTMLIPDTSCSESQVKRKFRNLKSTVVEAFLTMAIKKGLIKEVTPGNFKLTTDR